MQWQLGYHDDVNTFAITHVLLQRRTICMIILTMYLQVLLKLQAARLHLQGTVQQPCLQAVCGGALGKGKTETVLGEA